MSFVRSLSSIHNCRETVGDGKKESDVIDNAEVHGGGVSKKKEHGGIQIGEKKCEKRVDTRPPHRATSLHNANEWPDTTFSNVETQLLHETAGRFKSQCRNSSLRNSVAREKRERRSSVTFVDEVFSYYDKDVNAEVAGQIRGFREDYSLGDSARDPSHMIIGPATNQTVSSLKKLDFAFVKRRDGSYSYAILACRGKKQVKGSSLQQTSTKREEYMIFVVDDIGSRKMIFKRNWDLSVRLVAV